MSVTNNAKRYTDNMKKCLSYTFASMCAAIFVLSVASYARSWFALDEIIIAVGDTKELHLSHISGAFFLEITREATGDLAGKFAVQSFNRDGATRAVDEIRSNGIMITSLSAPLGCYGSKLEILDLLLLLRNLLFRIGFL